MIDGHAGDKGVVAYPFLECLGHEQGSARQVPARIYDGVPVFPAESTYVDVPVTP
jgi:hypothetical protein